MLAGGALSMRKFTLTCSIAAAALAFATSAMAQTGSTGSTGSSDPVVAVPTASGDTGIWWVPSARVLPHKKWSVSFYEVNTDDGQGFTDVTKYPVTFGVGIKNRLELFGSFSVINNVDRDTRPLFFISDASEQTTGTGGGITVDNPLIDSAWSGNKVGDLWLGGKVNLLGSNDKPFAVAARAQVKVPTGSGVNNQTSSGVADYQFDAIVSGHRSMFDQPAAFANLMARVVAGQ